MLFHIPATCMNILPCYTDLDLKTTQTTNPTNHKGPKNIRIREDLIFFSTLHDVLRFSKKQLRIFVGFCWIRP